ncbi:MAG: hypothetical protein IJZ96_05135 [Lachnospiraceae bacterium]|nr:hypothetical protein [Lachnospiraceae bacterium]
MRCSADVYKNVEERCSSYDNKNKKYAMTNVAGDSKSCLNCRHFAEDEHCRLDLYDPIAKNIGC